MKKRSQRAPGSGLQAPGCTCLVAVLLLGCDERPSAPDVAPRASDAAPSASVSASVAALPPLPWKAAAIAHGGIGTPPNMSDGCKKAVDAALGELERGADPVDAAVAGVVVMEDDPRFNAGTGSRIRIDGETIQMDAAVMRSDGRFGAVAVIEQVKNPVRVARAVLDTPHLVLAGEGATAFARTLGMPAYDPSTDEMRAATKGVQQKLRARDPELPDGWKDFDFRARWNFERSLADAGLSEVDVGSDTVGVAVRAADGRFAAALSTGGTSITLRGRVGDVPIYGAGLFAGPHGAVAATGTGERIIEHAVGKSVHARLEAGEAPDRVARAVVDLIAKRKGAIGLVVIGADALAAIGDRPMAWAARLSGSTDYQGP